MTGRCRYDAAPAEAFTKVAGGTVLQGGETRLFTWAHEHPASAVKLLDVPRRLSRNALAGHRVGRALHPQPRPGRRGLLQLD